LTIKSEGGDLLGLAGQRRPTLYRELLQNACFFELLLKIDREELDEVRAARCPVCGGPLHAGHFERKARGLLVPGEEWPKGFDLRFDLCCGWCRKRVMPSSVRYLGRKVYLAAVVAIATVLQRGRDRNAVALVRRELGISLSTLARWRQWWGALTGTAFWSRVRGLVPVDLDAAGLPESLLARYAGTAADRTVGLLRLLGPLTGTLIPEHAG
jgi:hypothetical protein